MASNFPPRNSVGDMRQVLTTPVASINDVETLELAEVGDIGLPNSNNYAAANNYSRQASNDIYESLADYRQAPNQDQLPEGRSKWRPNVRRRSTNRIAEMLPSRKMGTATHDSLDGWRRRSIQANNFMRQQSQPQEDHVYDRLAPDIYQNFPSTKTYKSKRKMKKEIRALPTHLRIKKEERLKASALRDVRKPGLLTRWKYWFLTQWNHLKHFVQDLQLSLWNSHMKIIEGFFGTGVVSYFIFLRWLVFLNIPVFILPFCFIFIPQLTYASSQSSQPFAAIDLLTGSGWFTNTELYYGYYTNNSIPSRVGGPDYNMPIAYLFTCGGYFLVGLIALMISLSIAYTKTYQEGSRQYHRFASKLFTAWHYSVTDPPAAVLKHKSIFTELQETLADIRRQHFKSGFKTKVKKFSLRLLSNAFAIALVGGSGYLVYFIGNLEYERILQTNDQGAQLIQLAVPVTIAVLNNWIPFGFTIIAYFEHYSKPRHELVWTLIRTILLMGTNLVVMIVTLLRKLTCDFKQFENPTCKGTCWETVLGQEFYRLILIDFLFLIFNPFVKEFLRRLLAQYLSCCQGIGKPEFNVSFSVLELIYSQALCWIGIFFAPMLAVYCAVKLVLVFYIRRISLIQNCRPSLRPYRTAKNNVLFTFLLFLTYLVSLSFIIVCILMVRPSLDCGPFRGHARMYTPLTELIAAAPAATRIALSYVTSTWVILAVIAILALFIYYFRTTAKARKGMIRVLNAQLELERLDKKFLLNVVQDFQEKELKANEDEQDEDSIELIDEGYV